MFTQDLKAIELINGKIFKSNPPRVAASKLDKGPAAAVNAVSLRGLLKFLSSTGTGLAHPKQKVTN